MFIDLKKISDRTCNKPFLMLLLTTLPHLEYVATLLCNLLLITCFLTLLFHKVVWQHMQGVVEFLVTTLLQIYEGVFQWENFKNRLRYDIMAMHLCPHFFG